MTRSPEASRRRSTRIARPTPIPDGSYWKPRHPASVIDKVASRAYHRALLPADDSGYGFDNISDVLSLSPALLERYMSAAGKISRLAVGDAAVRPSVQTYSVPQTLLQRDRMNEAMPFGRST